MTWRVFLGMYVVYVVVTVLVALACGYAASLNLVGAESVKVVADRVRLSRTLMAPCGIVLASAAAGLLVGFAVPALGIAAASGLVLYFVVALGAHVRVRDRGVGGAVGFLVIAAAALTVNVVYRVGP